MMPVKSPHGIVVPATLPSILSFVLFLGNPVEDERDSGLNPNTIPL
jgi:hypothetical protein